MTTTTHSEWNVRTEGTEVAQAFAEQIKDTTILVTGVNPGGVGYAIAESFASQAPAHLILAGRTPSKANEAIQSLKEKYPTVDYRHLKVDLSSQQSVREAAREALGWDDIPGINLMINSAGVMLIPERTLSEDNIEMHFATNHIGHFLLTNLLMPKLIHASKQSPRGATRVINVTSLSPKWTVMRWSDLNFDKPSHALPEAERPDYERVRAWGTPDPETASYIAIEGYGVSKVANVLFGIAANKRLYEKYGILALANHPGIIQTELGRNASDAVKQALKKQFEGGQYQYQSTASGAATSIVAALDPKLGMPEDTAASENHGAYLSNCQIDDEARALAVSSTEAEKLWALSEQLVGEKFSW